MDAAAHTIADFLERLSAKSPTPGGGAVAPIVGSLGAALGSMVVAYSVGKKSLAQHEPALQDAAATLTSARADLLRLADADARAYARLNDLMKLPEGDPRRESEFPNAVAAAVDAPMGVITSCVELLRMFESLASKTNRHLRSDLAIAAVLAHAAAAASRWNVRINAPLIEQLGDSAPASLRAAPEQAAALVDEARDLAGRVEAACV